MVTMGIAMTGQGAIGAAAMPVTAATVGFGSAGVALAVVAGTVLVGGFLAICIGAMRQFTVPTTRGVHGRCWAASSTTG
jgi:hypothetical protein